MVRRYAETINMGELENPLHVDIYHDTDVGKVVSYALRSFKTLNALKKCSEVNVGKGIETYSAKLPQFNERTRLHAGFCVPSPYGQGKYWIVLDERLNESEKLAVAFHEISHFAGGYHSNEKKAQKTAIDNLANLATNYEQLGEKRVINTLKRDAGIEYDIKEKEKTELGKALKILVDSAHSFGLDQNDLDSLGVRSLSQRNLERLVSLLFLLGGIFLLIPFNNITGNIINEININSFKVSSIIGILFILISITIFSYKKIIFPRLI